MYYIRDLHEGDMINAIWERGMIQIIHRITVRIIGNM